MQKLDSAKFKGIIFPQGLLKVMPPTIPKLILISSSLLFVPLLFTDYSLKCPAVSSIWIAVKSNSLLLV